MFRNRPLPRIAALLIAASPLPAWATPALLPLPRSIAPAEGSFRLDARTAISVPAGDAGARNAAERLGELLFTNLGLRPAIGSAGAISFVRTKGLAKEAYRLEVGAKGVTITANDDAGLLYGAITLWQLATVASAEAGAHGSFDKEAAVKSERAMDPGLRRGDGVLDIPSIRIDDAPRFAWRGLMLDSARHFQSPAFVKQLIDWMAAHKLNTLHWHLVDDQGWRLEIKKYPKLTEVSGWRTPASAPGAPTLPKTGGFYTQDEVREIVAYAAARAITIVPEIEMPGHAVSAIRAYPELGVGPPLPPGVESDWGVFPWLYNVDDSTFSFLEDVLTETMALFPSTYIHVGGDEAVKDQWQASPKIQARMRELGIKDEHGLQSWFIHRIELFLNKHGRRLIGWDEILEGGLAPNATVMSWRGIDGAVAAAQAGHDAVLSPAPTLYLNHRQGTGRNEPPGRGQVISLADVYAFEPAPASLTADQQRHILGVQGNLWTEHARTEQRAMWMMFPRASAVAELGWSAAGTRNYQDFMARLAPQLDRLKSLGLEAATTAFETEPAPARLKTCTDEVVLNLEDDAPAAGPRAIFLTDILNPCWKYEKAAMDGVTAIAVKVGQIPFNFQIGKDLEKIRFRPPATPEGEVEVRIDGCEGPKIATLPLAPAVANPAVTTLRAPIAPQAGTRDLCFTYTARGPDPMWAIDSVQLEGAPKGSQQ
ncbi:hypothetical protein ACFB49_47530 [Sphingomonas sp. DBB INV C78]|uniref:family 20 glycosylhydrolase n=1 Tax=Sphingomonas sp. DBB INV C78 TaxID=3349434 RepID=UPI0036D43769